MESLPFAIEYGGLTWKLVLVGLCVVAFWVSYRRWTQRWLRRLARSAVEAMGEPRPNLDAAVDGREIVLRGTLIDTGSDQPPMTRFEDGARACGSTAIPLPRTTDVVPPPVAVSMSQRTQLVLNTGDTEVLLGSPVEVIVGSRELYAGQARRLAQRQKERIQAIDDQAIAVLEGKPVAFLSLGSGDKVRARGIIRRVAGGEDPMGYRSATAQWVLEGEPKPMLKGPLGVPKVLLAFEGDPHFVVSRSKGLLRAAVVSAIAGVTTLLFSWGVGAATVDLDEPGEPTFSTQIAAFTPFHRQVALDRYTESLARSHPQSAMELTSFAQARSLSRGCGSEAWTRAQFGDFESAVSIAQDCQDSEAPRIAAESLYAMGHFREASLALDSYQPESDDEHWISSPFETRVHLLAHREDRAIESARFRARRLRWMRNNHHVAVEHLGDASTRSSVRDRVSGDFSTAAELFDCFADAFEARDGSMSPLRSLRRRAQTTGLCRALVADLIEPSDSSAEMHRETWVKIRPGGAMSELLLLEVQPERSHFSGRALSSVDGWVISEPQRYFEFSSPGLERRVLEVLDGIDSPSDTFEYHRAELRTRVAILELISGDHEAARREAGRASAHIRSVIRRHRQARMQSMRPPEHRLDRIGALFALIAISRGETEVAREHIAGISARSRDRFDSLDLLSLRERGYRAYLPAVDPQMRLWAPRVTEGRSRLAHQLRWSDAYRCRDCSLGQLLIDAGLRRSTADALGDVTWASSLEESIERIREAMARRDIAVHLWILDHIADS